MLTKTRQRALAVFISILIIFRDAFSFAEQKLLNVCDCDTTVTVTTDRGGTVFLSLDDNAKMLSSFGLTTNQAKVYLTVAKLGIATVGQASKASQVRREDVYRILPKLVNMGLIEKVLGTPVKLKAIPVEEALHTLIEKEQEIANRRMAALTSRKDKFLKRYKQFTVKPVSKEAHFSLISNREGIMGKEMVLVRKARSNIDIITSRDELRRFLNNYDDSLKKAMQNGVKVRVILNVTDHDASVVKMAEEYNSRAASFSLKYKNQPSGHFTIVDYKQALLKTSKEAPMGEHPCLWTDDNILVGLMQKTFETIWHTSTDVNTIQTEGVTEKATRFAKSLKPTNHIVFFYSSPETKYTILFNYLKVGLENGEAAVYVASDENPTEIRNAMNRFGIEVEKNEQAGALQILGYKEIYIMDGKFDTSTTMDRWNALFKDALAKGFKGMRVTGEMACFFDHNLVLELLEYEKSLHRVLDVPMIAICAYNTDAVIKASDPLDIYNELLKAHGTVLFSGINKQGKIEIRKS